MNTIRNRFTGAVILEGEESLEALLVKAAAAGIFLRGAVLRGAVLTGADLTGADLTGADLTGADLTGADLTDAVLRGADLTDADLTGAVLRGAVLRGAVLTGAVLTDAEIPIIENLDQKILALVESGAGILEMGAWHTCQTTHCRAGWAVHLAGDAGYALEAKFDTAAAGALIYAKSCPLLKIPNFYASNESALNDMRKRVGKGC